MKYQNKLRYKGREGEREEREREREGGGGGGVNQILYA